MPDNATPHDFDYKVDTETLEFRIPLEHFPDVHNSADGLHVHAETSDGPAIIAAMDGDTPRGLLALGMTYLALADAMHRGLNVPQDGQYVTPKTAAENARRN